MCVFLIIIYFPGGYDGTSFLDIVEVYDPTTNLWSAGSALTSVRSGHASAVCYQHVTPHTDHCDQLPAIIKKLGKRPSASNTSNASTSTSTASLTRSDDIPMANNIIGTLSNPRNPSDCM